LASKDNHVHIALLNIRAPMPAGHYPAIHFWRLQLAGRYCRLDYSENQEQCHFHQLS
jgi:hypothetical protein